MNEPNQRVGPPWTGSVALDADAATAKGGQRVGELKEPLPGPDADATEQLAHIIPALWRTLTRATRAAQALPGLESQVSVLRKLVARGPMSPAQLADELHLARPTVSNLVKDLVRAGLVERRPSDSDRRSVFVLPTSHGRRVLETFRHDRAKVLQEALSNLSEHDRSQIVTTIGALRGLIQQLEVEAVSPTDGDLDVLREG